MRPRMQMTQLKFKLLSFRRQGYIFRGGREEAVCICKCLLLWLEAVRNGLRKIVMYFRCRSLMNVDEEHQRLYGG